MSFIILALFSIGFASLGSSI